MVHKDFIIFIIQCHPKAPAAILGSSSYFPFLSTLTYLPPSGPLHVLASAGVISICMPASFSHLLMVIL